MSNNENNSKSHLYNHNTSTRFNNKLREIIKTIKASLHSSSVDSSCLFQKSSKERMTQMNKEISQETVHSEEKQIIQIKTHRHNNKPREISSTSGK